MTTFFYTRKEVAQMFKTSTFTVDSWIKNNQLACHKVNSTVRISNENIAEFLVSTTKAAKVV